jgi:DNA-binding MarR family transcriptional regulator
MSAYTLFVNGTPAMTRATTPKPELCNCLALRQAARHVTQFYDQFLAPAGLRTTQFSILARLRWFGPLTINALAKELVMDRTTLGRNILPLEREGLIEVTQGSADRRSKELRLTEAGRAKLRQASVGWAEAQARFEGTFGRARSSELRGILQAVSTTELAASSANE